MKNEDVQIELADGQWILPFYSKYDSYYNLLHNHYNDEYKESMCKFVLV